MSNPLLDLISRGESGAAGYNAYNRGTYTGADGKEHILGADRPIDFSNLTLGQVQELQHAGRRDPDRLFAVGKYQIIPDTMDWGVRSLKLDPDQKFTPELQDRLFSEFLIVKKQPSVHDYIVGKPGATLEKAQIGLAAEWASFADPRTGKSYYDKPGGANHSSITAEQSADALNKMRAEYKASIDKALSPEEAWKAVTASDPNRAQTLSQPHQQPAEGHPTQSTHALLKQGSEGPEVRQLQETLTRLGYRGSDGRPLAVDSDFGRNTDHALRAFQRAHGLEADGKIGPDTRAALAQAAQRPLVSEASHPNHALFQAIGRQLPEGTDPKAVANITLQALENGITRPDQLQGMAVRGSDVHLQGPYPGARVTVDLNAPTPDLQAMSDHMRMQTQERAQEQQHRGQQSRSPQTLST